MLSSLKKGVLLMGLLSLFGCGPSLEKHAELEPKMDLKEYFTGPIKAWGLIQDYSGNVVSRFDVTMVGTWDGDTGVLEEEFVYYTGNKDTRTWTITKTGDGQYEGRAGDIIGKAVGEEKGAAIRWAYEMEIPVDGTTHRVKLDDWMWRMNDGILINRSYIKKFGITVAELTLVMQKQ